MRRSLHHGDDSRGGGGAQNKRIIPRPNSAVPPTGRVIFKIFDLGVSEISGEVQLLLGAVAELGVKGHFFTFFKCIPDD